MKTSMTAVDKKFVLRCIELSRSSVRRGGNPFGCVITKKNVLIAESINGKTKDIVAHAEILALKKAREKLKTDDLSMCTLYSNCEPCPMCAFMIREFKIRRVVFALRSPFMGGYTKWKILQDKELSRFKPIFSHPPIVEQGICEKESSLFFDEIGWTMHRRERKKV